MARSSSPQDGDLFIARTRPPGRKSLRLGIMGGTFNPVHYGHLLCAEQARCKFNMDEVVFVPSGHPPHKKEADIAPTEHRYLMTVLAISTNPYFSVSRTEVDRKGKSYAIDTIRYFLETYKERNPRLYFITGSDAVMEILTWRRHDEIMDLATVIAASRPGYDFNKLRDAVGADRFRKLKLLQASALAISSTDIRERVRDTRPIKYLLPESVEHHIRKHGLYSNPA
jgi:nicotinate-nucleotide adenylyltransferase